MNDRVLLIDKDAGPTSHDVIDALRRVLRTRRIGHAGTLDPFATGLLVCCVGRATRLASYLGDFDKRYHGRVRLGEATDTLDVTGQITRTAPVPRDWRQRLAAVVGQFHGEIQQVPPMVSAVRVGGERLYALARRGVEVERPPRTVVIHALAVTPLDGRELDIDVHCSKGTYVRSLAADLGEALGTCASLTALRRVAIGALSLEGAVRSSELEAPDAATALDRASLSPFDALSAWPAVELSTEIAGRVAHGMAPRTSELGALPEELAPGTTVRLTAPDGTFVAIACAPAAGDTSAAAAGNAGAAGDEWRLLRVLAAADASRDGHD